MGLSILIVDDDKLLVEKLEETVNWSGIGIDMVFTANNIRQAQKLLEEYPIEMLLCDIDMPQGNGLELLEWIRYKKLDIECTFLSSYANFAYAQMALKLSSREYLLKPISNVDLETALRRIVGIVQEKHQKQKKQEKKGENEKQFWEDLLVQCLQEEYWIERAKKSGYCTPDETFRLILLRVLEIPDKEHYKKEISLYNFVITNVLTEYVETTEMKLETVVHVSDLEWAVVLRNHGSAMGTQEELAEQLFVTRQTVSNYENGRTRPDVDQILRLAEIFDTDANAVLYGPPVPEGRKTALIQAAAGCALTAAIYLLYRFFLPTAQDIQSFHYDPRWTAALMYVVRPVFLLLLGWSLVQVLSLAAAVKLPEKPWVRCRRRTLLVIVLCGILSSLFVCIAFFVDVGNVYSVLRPFLYRIIKWNQKPIFHSLLGALLCLLGFPPKRKAPVEKQISQ